MFVVRAELAWGHAGECAKTPAEIAAVTESTGGYDIADLHVGFA